MYTVILQEIKSERVRLGKAQHLSEYVQLVLMRYHCSMWLRLNTVRASAPALVLVLNNHVGHQLPLTSF